MEQWLQFARGPLFIMALLYMILSLARLFAIQLLAVPVILKSGGAAKPGEVSRRAMEYVVPLGRFLAAKPAARLVSVAWHVVVVATPLFLVDHVMLWNRGFGFLPFGWPLSLTVPKHAADALVVAAVVLTALMFAVSRPGAGKSGPADRIVLLLILGTFVMGFLAAHPGMSPVNYTATMLIHVLAAELVFVLLPGTEFSHTLVLPAARVVAKIIWKKLPDGAGEKIAGELYGGRAEA